MTVEQMIRAEAVRQGVPPDLAIAVARRESGMNPNVGDGTSGEVGMFQVKPSTAADMGVHNPRDLASNIQAGVAYLKWNYTYFGDWTSAVLGYNAGPGNVQRGTISQQARSYLSWIESQVPSLFGGGDTVLVAGGGSSPTPVGSSKGSVGTELLDPSAWSFFGGSRANESYPETYAVAGGKIDPLLAAGVLAGLAAVVWIAS